MTNKDEIVVSALQYLLFKLKEQRGNKNIGRTLIQKLMFLLNRQEVVDLNYTLYHYGPFSNELSAVLDETAARGIINETWQDGSGYDISLLGTYRSHPGINKKCIEEVVKQYGNYSAGDISIIATALFLKDKYNVHNDELIELVNKVKPNYSIADIKKIIKEAPGFN
jgi:uncharacterized protein YwgA